MKFPRRSILVATLLASLSWFAAGPAHAQSAGRTQTAAASQVAAGARVPTAAVGQISNAETEKAYRVDAARHIYAKYPDKIYPGKLPPMVHAVVVLEMNVDANGQLQSINLLRTPSHAPEVTAAVQEMIRSASPMPVPARL